MINPSDSSSCSSSHTSSLRPEAEPSASPLSQDPQEGVAPLTPSQQQEHLREFFEDHYPEILWHLHSDNLQLVYEQLEDLSEDRREEKIKTVEGYWSRLPDLLSHSSLLVLGAGLDHRMPGVAFSGASAEDISGDPGSPISIIRPSRPTGEIALGFRGGAPWFGQGQAREQFWLPLWGAIAELSGVAIVDINYSDSEKPSQEAQELLLSQVRRHLSSFLSLKDEEKRQETKQQHEKKIGIISVGCGYDPARSYEPWAQWAVHFSPDIRPRNDIHSFLKEREEMDIPQLFSTEIQDSWLSDYLSAPSNLAGERPSQFSLYSYPIQNHIGAPAVWRQRIEEAAAWIKAVTT